MYHHCGPKARIVLIGSKLDLAAEHREVQYAEGKAKALKEGWPFIENSSLSQENLKETFDTLIKVALDEYECEEDRKGVLAAIDNCLGRVAAKLCCLKGGDDEDEDTGQHEKPIFCLHASGGLLYSGARDCTVRTWDTRRGTCKYVVDQHDDQIYDIKTWKGKLVTASADGAARVFDGEELLCKMEHTAEVNQLQIFPETDRLFSASGDKTIICWDLHTGTKQHVYNQSPSPVNCLGVHSSSGGAAGLILAGCADGLSWH